MEQDFTLTAGKRPLGLAVLTPVFRLIIVISTSLFFILIKDIYSAAALFLIGGILFILNTKHHWRLAAAVPFTGIMLIVANTLFSPEISTSETWGTSWWIFTINGAGLRWGLITGLRMMGMMLISFAWLFCTSLPEIYESLAWIKFARPWTQGLLRGIQILKREFMSLTHSLLIRGLKWDSLRNNIRNLVPLITAILPRIVENSQMSALASQSHIKPDPGKIQDQLVREGEIQIENLTVRYDAKSVDILDQVSLSIQPGEFVYVAGRSKAGKTTLLRAIAGVIPWIMGEMKGEVRISGLVTSEHYLSRLNGAIRYISPDPFSSIYGLTVSQEILSLSSSEEEARRALTTMGIEGLWDRETTTLSGGEQVRLVLAGALTSKAKILLFDSPMQELDPDGRQTFLDALKILRESREITVIISDFFWKQLTPYISRVLVLENKKIAADLPAEEFFSKDENIDRNNLGSELPALVPVESGEIVAELDDIHVSLGGNHILKGLSLRVHKGELIVIMGPNGAGKTTAMLALCKAVTHQSGRVHFAGSIGYAFQHASLQMTSMTVEEELLFGPKLRNWDSDKCREKLDSGLRRTRLKGDDCPFDLHSVDLRMLSIESCELDSTVFILDEPTIGLDSDDTIRIFNRINELRSTGCSVIIITHDENIASQADRALFIDGGRVAKEFRPEKGPALDWDLVKS